MTDRVCLYYYFDFAYFVIALLKK